MAKQNAARKSKFNAKKPAKKFLVSKKKFFALPKKKKPAKKIARAAIKPAKKIVRDDTVPRLKSWLNKEGHSITLMAHLLGYHCSTAINQWVRRKSIPKEIVPRVRSIMNSRVTLTVRNGAGKTKRFVSEMR